MAPQSRTRSLMPTSPPSVEYALTELGMELVPVIDSIVRVGTRLLKGNVSCGPVPSGKATR